MWNALFSRFGHAFMFDSGSSTGEILGHSKVPSSLGACMCVLIEGTITSLQVVNAVAIRRQRPFRAATAGDDNLIIFHQGNAIAA